MISCMQLCAFDVTVFNDHWFQLVFQPASAALIDWQTLTAAVVMWQKNIAANIIIIIQCCCFNGIYNIIKTKGIREDRF